LEEWEEAASSSSAWKKMGEQDFVHRRSREYGGGAIFLLVIVAEK